MIALILSTLMIINAVHFQENQISFEKTTSIEDSECKEVKITYLKGTKPDPKDADIEKSAKSGCEEYYGKGACLTKLIKKSATDWNAICAGGTK